MVLDGVLLVGWAIGPVSWIDCGMLAARDNAVAGVTGGGSTADGTTADGSAADGTTADVSTTADAAMPPTAATGATKLE